MYNSQLAADTMKSNTDSTYYSNFLEKK